MISKALTTLSNATGTAGGLGPDQVWLRVARAGARQLAPRDPRHAAVQAARVRGADQPVHGQRLGHPALHHRHLHEAEGR